MSMRTILASSSSNAAIRMDSASDGVAPSSISHASVAACREWRLRVRLWPVRAVPARHRSSRVRGRNVASGKACARRCSSRVLPLAERTSNEGERRQVRQHEPFTVPWPGQDEGDRVLRLCRELADQVGRFGRGAAGKIAAHVLHACHGRCQVKHLALQLGVMGLQDRFLARPRRRPGPGRPGRG